MKFFAFTAGLLALALARKVPDSEFINKRALSTAQTSRLTAIKEAAGKYIDGSEKCGREVAEKAATADEKRMAFMTLGTVRMSLSVCANKYILQGGESPRTCMKKQMSNYPQVSKDFSGLLDKIFSCSEVSYLNGGSKRSAEEPVKRNGSARDVALKFLEEAKACVTLATDGKAGTAGVTTATIIRDSLRACLRTATDRDSLLTCVKARLPATRGDGNIREMVYEAATCGIGMMDAN